MDDEIYIVRATILFDLITNYVQAALDAINNQQEAISEFGEWISRTDPNS